MGMTRKQIAFDLSHEALRQYYPRRETAQDPQFFKRAYKDIQQFMASNGFERRQHSVYVSSEEMTTLDVAVLMQRMASQFPWLRQCAEKVDTTDIGAQHSLLGLLRPNVQIDVSLDQQVGKNQLVSLSSSKADGWCFYIIADLKTWADNAENRSPLEHFSSFATAKARFEELCVQEYNSEPAEPGPDGQPPARLTLGLEHSDGMSSTDILQVRKGKNYLVTDFVRMVRVRDDPAAMDALARVSREIGFDFVRVYEQTGDRVQFLPNVPFGEWDNPYFPSATPGRIAAQYYELTHRCYPLPRDPGLRAGQIAGIVQFIQKEGKQGINQMALSVAGFGASFPDNPAVQEVASALIKELAQYDAPERDDIPQRKAGRKKSQER